MRRATDRGKMLRLLLRLVRMLAGRAHTVHEITDALDVHRRTAYRFLAALREADMLDSWREGVMGYHRLSQGWWGPIPTRRRGPATAQRRMQK